MSLIPAKEKSAFYSDTYCSEFPFQASSYAVKKSMPASRQQNYYDDLRHQYLCMAIACLDLGHPVDEARDWLGASFNALVHALKAQPTEVASEDAMFALFVTGIFRDKSASDAFLRVWSKTSEASGDPDDAEHEQHWALSSLCVARAVGKKSALDEAGRALKQMNAGARGKKWAPYYDAMRKLATDAVFAKTPKPLPLLGKLAPMKNPWYVLAHEDLLMQRPLAFACIARDRGWKVPKESPHPSIVFSLLELPARKVPLGDAWPRPGNDLKKQILAAAAADD